jgi:hypothetical protein
MTTPTQARTATHRGLPGLDGIDVIDVIEHHRVEVVECHCPRIEPVPELVGQAAQRPERAGDHQEPPVRPQQRTERADHSGGTEVVGVDEASHLIGTGQLWAQPGRRVGHHDVELLVPIRQPAREVGHVRWPGNVEPLRHHVLRQDRRSAGDSIGVTAGQIDGVDDGTELLNDSQAEALIRTGHQCHTHAITAPSHPANTRPLTPIPG